MHHRPSVANHQTLPPQLGAALRAEVRDLRRRAGAARAFPPLVGLRTLSPGGVPLPAGLGAVVPTATGIEQRELDHALRVDLLVATLGAMRGRGDLPATRPVGIMIARPGALEPTEDDLGWLRAWPVASDIGGCTRGPVWAITRHGWLDVGENRAVELPRHLLRRPPPGQSAPS